MIKNARYHKFIVRRNFQGQGATGEAEDIINLPKGYVFSAKSSCYVDQSKRVELFDLIIKSDMEKFKIQTKFLRVPCSFVMFHEE
jgi:hypothetical protein